MLHLKGFQLHFVPKMGRGVTSINFGVSGYIANNENIQYVRVSPGSKDQICLLCARVITNKVFRHIKLMTSGGQKQPKLVLEGRSPM